MCAVVRLSAEALYRTLDPSEIAFENTAQAPAVDGVVGQDRAVEAVRFGIGIRHRGYNLFAIGPSGVGKQTLLRQFLVAQAAREDTPPDWCYVQNFADPLQPRGLELPPGVGARLAGDMDRIVTELRVAMRAAFEGEEYRTRKQQLLVRFKGRQERAFLEVQERARQQHVAVVSTETGVAVAPLQGNAALDPADFERLPKDKQAELRKATDRVGSDLQEFFGKLHEWRRERQEGLSALDRDTAAAVARRVLDAVRARYQDLPAVLEHLSQIETDAIESAGDFLEAGPEGLEAVFRSAMQRNHSGDSLFRRYRVNVLVDHRSQRGAPVVYENHPTYPNLIGRIEHEAQFGALVTHFTLIRPGAFHRARGGYLILDALKLLQQPLAWDAVKRTLRAGEVRMESLGEALGLVSTVALEPAPMPLLDTKVVLLGERQLYYLLAAMDPEFLELFKVLVDFDEAMDRGPATQGLYANLVATLVQKEGLRPFDRGAVARVIEQASRYAGDAGKVSVHMRRIVDLLHETDFVTEREGRALATAEDVEAAIEAEHQRAGRLRERMQEAVRRHDILIDTAGERVGQVNGLSVVGLGEYAFGHPARITARVRMGKGEFVDIEREVELGGPIHSKGVLILGGFLGTRYTPRMPLSLSATLVFEQSYGPVEGDSASLAELCALLSALSELPIRQSFAMTGSVNQHGEVQAIGGVNEKIEGFFDVCRERGLTGEQGVLIPRSNVKNLMLRRDVVAAVKAGEFGIFATDTVDDAIEVLTGRPAGSRDPASGEYPVDSVNGLVEARLVGFAESARSFLQRSQP